MASEATLSPVRPNYSNTGACYLQAASCEEYATFNGYALSLRVPFPAWRLY